MEGLQLEGQLDSANLRQCYVNFFFRCVCQVAAVYCFPYLAMAKNHSFLSWIQMLIRITTKS